MAMVSNIVNKDVGAGLSPKELGLLAGAKVLSERVTMPYIGNSTLKSGLIKIGAGAGVAIAVQNKYVRFACAGVVLDGFEDLVEEAQNRFFKKSNNSLVGGLV